MIRKLLYFALVLALTPLLLAFTAEGIDFLASVFTFKAAQWFVAGAVGSLVVYIVLLNNSIAFIEHLLHELEHAIVSFLFTFQWPKRMEVDPAQGSKVVVTGKGGCLVPLAPYYLPLLTLPFLLVKALAALVFSLLNAAFPAILAAVLDLLIGATLTFHVVCTLKEFSYRQTDIRTIGLISSLVIVLFLSFVFLVLSVTVVIGSYAQFVDYVRSVSMGLVDTYQAAIGLVTEDVLPFLRDRIQSFRS
jgi:hypothetical protein